MDPHDYCQEKVAAAGSTLYYSFLFLPDERRRPLIALHAFADEIRAAVDGVSEPEAARMKVAWWRAELERLYAGSANHPVARALAPEVEHLGLEPADLEAPLAAADMDLEHGRYPDFAALERYCHLRAAVSGPLAARVTGYRDARTLDYARLLGTALALTRILCEVRADASRGRIYIPAEDLAEHGVRPAELAHGHTPGHVRRLLQSQARRARDCFERALATLPAVDRHAQHGGVIRARIALALLDEIERDGYRVLEHRVALTPLRKLWIAWRTARAGQWRHRLAGRRAA